MLQKIIISIIKSTEFWRSFAIFVFFNWFFLIWLLSEDSCWSYTVVFDLYGWYMLYSITLSQHLNDHKANMASKLLTIQSCRISLKLAHKSGSLLKQWILSRTHKTFFPAESTSSAANCMTLVLYMGNIHLQSKSKI
jgi:hypothetical protein